MSQVSASQSEVRESLVVCGPVMFWGFILINIYFNVD